MISETDEGSTARERICRRSLRKWTVTVPVATVEATATPGTI
jgi:hypothetical protein